MTDWKTRAGELIAQAQDQGKLTAGDLRDILWAAVVPIEDFSAEIRDASPMARLLARLRGQGWLEPRETREERMMAMVRASFVKTQETQDDAWLELEEAIYSLRYIVGDDLGGPGSIEQIRECVGAVVDAFNRLRPCTRNGNASSHGGGDGWR